MVAGFSHGDSRAKYNLTEPISIQVKHVAIKFVMERFHPSGPCLQTMKTFAQWRCADTSYFIRNWETHGGWERLIPSVQVLGTCPLPTPLQVSDLFAIRFVCSLHSAPSGAEELWAGPGPALGVPGHDQRWRLPHKAAGTLWQALQVTGQCFIFFFF